MVVIVEKSKQSFQHSGVVNCGNEQSDILNFPYFNAPTLECWNVVNLTAYQLRFSRKNKQSRVAIRTGVLYGHRAKR